jgi:hypothetical protein
MKQTMLTKQMNGSRQWLALAKDIHILHEDASIHVDLSSYKVKGLKDTLRLMETLEELESLADKIYFSKIHPSILSMSRMLRFGHLFSPDDDLTSRGVSRVA